MKIKKEGSVILLQVKDNYIKAIKYKQCKGAKIVIDNFEIGELRDGKTEKEKLKSAIEGLFKRISYQGEKIILILPHQKATSRYFRFPAHEEKEIEDMIGLQAGKILPYPAKEIIFGYQVVQIDNDGFSHVNLILLHKDVNEGLINILKECNLAVDSVFIATYGIQNILDKAKLKEKNQEMISINLDFPQVEIAMLKNKRICLSRWLRIFKDQPGWREQLVKNIRETQELYQRHSHSGSIKRIVVFDPQGNIAECKESIDKLGIAPIEVLKPPYNLDIDKKLEIENFPNSVIDLLGFTTGSLPESLNLLPPNLKEERRRIKIKKHKLKAGLIFGLAVVLLSISYFNHTNNKKLYLTKLEQRLEELKESHKDLESMAGKLQILRFSRREQKTVLDFFYSIHKASIEGIVIKRIKYDIDQNKEYILEGTSAKIDSVFEYASALKKTGLLNDYQIKVNYVSRSESEKTKLAEFEIVLLSKKR